MSKVPSGYFLTDVMMYTDVLFKGRLLKGAASKLQLAADEGVKLKKLVQAVRNLWRASPHGNHPHVTELKNLMRPSPRKSEHGTGTSDGGSGGVETLKEL